MNPTRSSSPLSVVVLLAALALGPGCVRTVRIQVSSSQDTNSGQILYMMVRATNDQALIEEDYTTAADRMFNSAQDESVQSVQAILPGTPVFLSVPRPAQERLALYFFFTDPGPNWKVPLDPPLPAEVQVELGSKDIAAVKVRRQ